MKVFKFGGASVNSADAVKNVVTIVNNYIDDNLLIVISAMGKTTNALEQLTDAYYNNDAYSFIYNNIKDYHHNIINELFAEDKSIILNDINTLFKSLDKKLNLKPTTNYDYEYDQIVVYGELLSTKIIHHYLKTTGVWNIWFDARKVIITDNTFKEAKVNWELTSDEIDFSIASKYKNNENRIIITQGFIGGTLNGISTSLGREGSDYTASIFAYCLNAEEVIIWKDVPGVLNADPKYFEDTHKLDSISYREAIELAYYGASIIHPKTIKPLQNKNIPLRVKSFINPEESGTIISDIDHADGLMPSFIFKKNQTLVSISPRDFSFIAEDNLSDIFRIIADTGIKINLMQNSAISFSICIDENKKRLDRLIESLKKDYQVKYNQELELITIRHYDQQTIDKIVGNRRIYVEQKNRLTTQLIVETHTPDRN